MNKIKAQQHLTTNLTEAACCVAVYISTSLRAVAGLRTLWMWEGHAYHIVCGLVMMAHQGSWVELPITTQSILSMSAIFKTMILSIMILN